MTLPVFVISLPEATERRAQIASHLKELGLAHEIVDAVDGRGFDVPAHTAYNGRRRRLLFGRDLTGGELGCALSHRSIYERMADENIPLALVLEDDVVLSEDIPAVLKVLSGMTDRFELVRFLGSKKVARLQQRVVADLGGGYSLNRLRTTPGGAHAYVVTLSGAQKLLRAMQRIDVPIDTLMGMVWRTGLNALIVQPGLSYQDGDLPNYIGQTRFDKSIALKGWERTVFPFTRAYCKLYEAAGKSWSYYCR